MSSSRSRGARCDQEARLLRNWDNRLNLEAGEPTEYKRSPSNSKVTSTSLLVNDSRVTRSWTLRTDRVLLLRKKQDRATRRRLCTNGVAPERIPFRGSWITARKKISNRRNSKTLEITEYRCSGDNREQELFFLRGRVKDYRTERGDNELAHLERECYRWLDYPRNWKLVEETGRS